MNISEYLRYWFTFFLFTFIKKIFTTYFRKKPFKSDLVVAIARELLPKNVFLCQLNQFFDHKRIFEVLRSWDVLLKIMIGNFHLIIYFYSFWINFLTLSFLRAVGKSENLKGHNLPPCLRTMHCITPACLKDFIS